MPAFHIRGLGPLARSLFAIVALSFSATSCSEQPALPSVPMQPSGALLSAGGQIQPMCVEGCLDADPAPDSAGYFLPGTMYTWDGCSGGWDQDEDGLSDDCELALAQAFAPYLSFAFVDDVRRESRWAARPEDGETVLIAYLFSYYLDMGDTGASGNWTCYGGWFACQGHNGDSEFIVLAVHYSQTTHHWYTVRLDAGRHESIDTYIKPSNKDWLTLAGYTTRVEFADRPLGYPTIWVANGKHASYATQSECNSGEGGIIPDTDDCSGLRTWVRFGSAFDSYIDHRYESNIGSRQHPLVDCVQSVNPDHPYYANHYQECYWTDKKFEGWFWPTSDPPTSAYTTILANFGW